MLLNMRSFRRFGWYGRRGIPLIAGASALATVATAADWLLGLGVVASAAKDGDAPELQMIVAGGALSLCLLACWRIARHGDDPLGDGQRSSARADFVLAAIVIATGVALSAYFLDLPLRLDESRTIFKYASQSFGTAVTSYDTTNNHVLHTMLVWAAHQLGGWNRVVLRMPAFLSSCLLLPALWWFARREYGPTAAAFTAALAATTPYFVELATNARGYTLLCLLFVGALLCGQALVHRPERKGLWATWAATIGLGFFTIPVMAFPALATVCWMTLARWHRRGREGLSSFVVKIAGWSVVALALAGALYTPILATIGINGMQTIFDSLGRHYSDATPLGLLRHSYHLWIQHSTNPAWFQGALLALVLVGAAVRARTCRRAGTLVLAMVVTTMVGLVARPTLLPARMVVWALLLFLVLAGAGAAAAFRGLTTRAEARWPRLVGTPPARLATTFCAVLLTLVCSGRWATQPDETRPFREWTSDTAYGLPALTFAVAEQVRIGDCITVDEGLEWFTIFYTKGWVTSGNRIGLYDPELGHVDRGAGGLRPSGRPLPGRWPVYGALPPGGQTSGSACGEPSGGPAQHHLFVLWSGTTDELWAYWRGPRLTSREFLEAHGDGSELAADFGDGIVFVFDD